MRLKMKGLKLTIAKIGAIGCLALLSGCTMLSQMLNPFYEAPSDVALLGEANDHALNGLDEKVDTARQALEYAATYQRAHTPQPNKPVMEAAMVRMMWVPDHLNKNGDLVPAHYYYLKVKKDQWAVTDAFEKESQLAPEGAQSNIPFVYEGDRGNQ
jgi:hypothetical protein